MPKAKKQKEPKEKQSPKSSAKVWKKNFHLGPSVGNINKGDEVTEAHRTAWAGATPVSIDDYIE